MPRIPIRQYLEEDPTRVLVMDGGQGTELENRGIVVASPVWSAAPFLDAAAWQQPDSRERAIVASVLRDFVAAGAEVIMTITYQASFTSVTTNTGITTLQDYNALLDRIVGFCRETVGDDKYLVGSIGAWGAHVCAEFTGDYGPRPDHIDYLAYFKPQLDNFNAQPALDLIGFETIPNAHELRAILSWDESVIAKPFYVALSVHDAGTLRDGTPMADVAAIVAAAAPLNPNFLGLGINCSSLSRTPAILAELHALLPALPMTIYPNSGEIYDPVKKVWNASPHVVDWGAVVASYIRSGARIIGGCCRTTPNDIRQIADAVRTHARASSTDVPGHASP
ncbi:FABL125Wp [Eremothecium gossypii FDAG1]|nr:FABL125Wp [Eremothecium gossypii FDAG1]